MTFRLPSRRSHVRETNDSVGLAAMARQREASDEAR